MILLVEDSEDGLNMLMRRMTSQGFRIRCAVDGPAGVQMTSKEHPELILMDVALGDMDGWEATQLNTAAPETAMIPIITLTVHTLSSNRAKSPADAMPLLLGKTKACLEAPRSHSPGGIRPRTPAAMAAVEGAET
jgi:CheY-like chemotaxis protein